MNTYMSTSQEWHYDKPGVYLEEGFSPPRRDPFSTGVPVFIGRCKTTEDKDVGKLHQLALWSHFPQYVGKTYHDCTLGYAVRGFFSKRRKPLLRHRSARSDT